MFDDSKYKPSPQMLKTFDTSKVKNFDRANMGLLPLRCDTWGGIVFVNVSGDAPPLLEYLGDVVNVMQRYPLNDLSIVHRNQWDLKSNWKVLGDNYLEYYHLPAVHPALCKVSGVDEHVKAQGKGMYMLFATQPLSDGVDGGTPLDPSRIPPYPGIDKTEGVTAWHTFIFPNTFFSVYPHHIYQIIMEPHAPGHTVEHATLRVHPTVAKDPAMQSAVKGVEDFFTNVNNEDVNICEAVQLGTVAKGYTGGRFSFHFEETLHRFQNMIADHMVGKPRIPEKDPKW
jgi:phenylpropionate dioxygenase-like ring-hydroxylating dioxygenase large terminal subunit